MKAEKGAVILSGSYLDCDKVLRMHGDRGLISCVVGSSFFFSITKKIEIGFIVGNDLGNISNHATSIFGEYTHFYFE